MISSKFERKTSIKKTDSIYSLNCTVKVGTIHMRSLILNVQLLPI